MKNSYVYPDEDSNTTLININRTGLDEMDEYIGPEHKSYNLDQSPLDNPYDKSEYGVDEAVEHYKLYFYRKYIQEEELRKYVHKLEGKTLGCVCEPEMCHGEPIVDILNVYHNKGSQEVMNKIKNEIENIDREDLGVEGFKEYRKLKDVMSNSEKIQ